MRLLHLADVHLGARLSAFGEVAGERRHELLRAFRGLPEVAAGHEADAVLVAGDLFDSPQPGSEILAAVRETFRRLVEADRPVFVVPGNHDSHLLHPNPYRDPLGGAYVFKAPAFGAPQVVSTKAGLLVVYGLSYDRASEPAPLATFERASAPGRHVVLLHGAVRDSPQWSTSPNVLRLTTERLAELPVDYVALGDHHSYRPLTAAAGSAPVAVFSGSFAAQRLSEVGRRGYLVVDLEEGRPPAIVHESSGLPEVIDLGELEVGQLESEIKVADALAASMPPAGGIPVATLVGEPAYPLDPDEVQANLAARFGHARVVDRTTYYSSARLTELAEHDTLSAHVARLGLARLDACGSDESARRTADRALRIALRALGVR